MVYEAIQWHIPSLLESGDDLEPLLDRLPFRERDELIDSLKINTAGLFAKAVAKFKRHQLSDQIPSDAINALIDELSEKASDILSGEQRNVIKSVFFVKISTSLSEIAKKHFPRHHRLVYSVFLDTLLEFIPNDPVHVSTPHASSMAFFSEGSYQNEACEPSYKHTVKHRAFC